MTRSAVGCSLKPYCNKAHKEVSEKILGLMAAENDVLLAKIMRQFDDIAARIAEINGALRRQKEGDSDGF